MRQFIIVSLLLYQIGFSFAQETWDQLVGPGVRHRKIYDSRGPWAIDLVEIDLSNSHIHIESVKAGDCLTGLEKTSAMAARNHRAGHWIVAAINADFFEPDGTPTNCQVVNGQLLKTPGKNSIIGFYNDSRPFIARLNFKGELILPDHKVLKVHGINRIRNQDELILYNPFFGRNTQTNIWGAEFSFQTIDQWAVNDTVRIRVIAIDSTKGNQEIQRNGGVLSGHGVSRTKLLRWIDIGDTLRVVLQLNPIKGNVKNIVGGIPRIIRDGKISIEDGYDSSQFALNRHPRTAVGFNRDTTKIFLFTVDGRQAGYSAGMTLYEEAEFLLNLNAYQAINLDGGGSTTMVVHTRVENRPSDPTGERPVSNGLLVISDLPLSTYSQQKTKQDSSLVQNK